jgi:hypothetical protein
MWLWDNTRTGTPADLGTPGDPGLNVFRCNSGANSPGADLWIVGDVNDPEAGWDGTVQLAGNSWDHDPPTIQTAEPYTNGNDISLGAAPHVALDLSYSSVSTAECPANRTPGPTR